MQLARTFFSEALLKFRNKRTTFLQFSSIASFQLTVFQSSRVNCQHQWSKVYRAPTFRPKGGPVRFQHGPNGTMKLDSREFHACFSPQLRKLAAIFTKHGFELRIAGGAVRDMLMGRTPHDIDFATNATPDQMKAMFAVENVKTFNEKGEKHGTVSARIDGKQNFEITTLRIDVRTDGRHAEVQFTQDWVVDANRRDLTVNSMYLGLDGTLYDYFNGHEDLKNGVCSFVGNADDRIKEDYLRILRYFRFFGRICKDPNAHKTEVLTTIQNNMGGLLNISGERIWSELAKILQGEHAKEMVLTMADLGLMPYMGLPVKEKLNITEFERLMAIKMKERDVDPIVKIASLVHTEEEVLEFHGRCKLSALERDLALFIIHHRDDICDDPNPLKMYQNLLLFSKIKATTMREFIMQLLKYQDKHSLMREFRAWRLQPFPLNGNILRAYGVQVFGKDLGILIEAMKVYWSQHGFEPCREDLLRALPDVMIKLNMTPVYPKLTPDNASSESSAHTEFE